MPNEDFITSPWAKVDPNDPQKSLDKLPNQTKLVLAKGALEGKCFTEGGGQFDKLFHHWLLWMHCDHPKAHHWWHWMSEQPEAECVLSLSESGTNKHKAETVDLHDRDIYTIRLWHTMNEDGGANHLAKEQVKKKITTWSYYERHFFNWFLGRFNVVDARQVFNKHWISRYIHLPVSLVTTALAIWYFSLSCKTSCDWLLSLLSIVLVFTLGNVFAWIKPAYYIQSLMPRMAVTIGIGYLFLFSASGLVTAIYYNQLRIEWQVLIALTLVILVLFYMVQIIQRRVQPRLKDWPSFTRSLHLMLMAIAYSAVGLLISAPILFDPLFISPADRSLSAPPAGYGYLLITAAIALAIGVALQLVWEDRPVTEPL